MTVVEHSGPGLLIGASWREGGGPPLGTWNPALGSLVDVFAAADERDVRDAVSAARAAAPAWAGLPCHERASALLRCLGEVDDDASGLADTLTQEIGATRAEARAEVSDAVSRIRPGLTEVERAEYPLGHTGLITPWHSPLTVGLSRAFAALLAGNTVIWKPAPQASAVTARAVQRLSGLPAGVLNLILGPGEVALALARSELSGFHVAGTASAARWLCTEALAAGTPISADVAAPAIAAVLGNADVDYAARAIVRSACGLAGQRSGATRFVLAEARSAAALATALTEAMTAITIGDPADDRVAMGPLISADAARELAGSVDAALASDAECLVGGDRISELGETFFQATLLMGQTQVTQPGPVIVVSRSDLAAESVARLPAPVCASVFGGGRDRANVTAALRPLLVSYDDAPPTDVFETLSLPREAVCGARWMQSPLVRRREDGR